jgi:2-keto-4-pentenoate hydratase
MDDSSAVKLGRETLISTAAARLAEAASCGKPTPPVRDVLGRSDIGLAYEVQNVLTSARLARGAQVVGRKIGLTSPAVQRQLGVDQPDFGVLFDDMALRSGCEVDVSTLIAPKVEAEVAFVLSADLDSLGGPDDISKPVTQADRAAAAAAVAYAVAAIEIVDSRVDDWDISITDTIADNASSALFVLADRQVSLREFAPVDVTMWLDRNGERVSSGDGLACLGDPLIALAWLGRTAAAFGSPLRAGEVILSGALGPMVPAQAGDNIVAELSTLGRVSVTFR